MKNNLHKNHTKSLQPAHYIVMDVPRLSWRGACNTAPDPFHLQEREQAFTFSRVHAWEWQLRLWSLQICCKTPSRVTNPGHLNSKQHSPALEGQPKQSPPAEESVPLPLNFCSRFIFTLGQGLHPLPHQASCSCQPFFCKEWLVSAIPTDNAQPPHHL